MNVRILVVDDDEKILQSIKDVLEHRQYEICIAKTGREGLKQFEMVNPNLVITDIIMPDMEGIELIKSIKKKNKNIPIIAMSGDIVGQRFLRASRLLGAIDTLQKPFTGKQLEEKISSALSR